MAPTPLPSPAPKSANNTSVVPVPSLNEITVTPSHDSKNSTIGVDLTTRLDQPSTYETPFSNAYTGSSNEARDKKAFARSLKPDQISLKTLHKAFRRFKMSRKKGAGLIVTRYTRHGKPVY